MYIHIKRTILPCWTKEIRICMSAEPMFVDCFIEQVIAFMSQIRRLIPGCHSVSLSLEFFLVSLNPGGLGWDLSGRDLYFVV